MTPDNRRMPLFLAGFLMLAGPVLARHGPGKAATGIGNGARGRQGSVVKRADFLPPDEAFHSVRWRRSRQDTAHLGITDGYYLYRARIKASTTVIGKVGRAGAAHRRNEGR